MTMANIPNPVTYYSDYGYVEVDKAEMTSESQMVTFNKRVDILTGKLNV
jgi:hypothetical protein